MKAKYKNLIIDSWIKYKYARTLTISAMIFSIALCVFIFIFLNYNIKSSAQNIDNKMGADFMIIPKGEKKNNEGILLSGQPSAFYMNGEIEEALQKIEGVESINSQVFVATLASGCCSFPVQAIGLDFEKDFTIKHWLDNDISVNYNEVIAGSNLAIRAGEVLTFFDNQYKVAANLQPTGIGFDNSIFMTKDTALDMIKKANIKLDNSDTLENMISAVLIKKKKDISSDDLYLDIIRVSKDYDVEIVKSKDFVEEFLQSINNMMNFINILFCVIILFIIITLYSLLMIDAKDKKKDFASLGIIGMSFSEIKKLSIKYISRISIISSISGVLLGLLVVNFFNTIMEDKLKFSLTEFGITKQIITAVIIAIIINMAIIFIQVINVNKIRKKGLIELLRVEE